MPWSQVVARKRTSLMNATFEYDIHNSQQDKVIHSKVWRAGRSPGSVLLDMTDRSGLPVQLMTLIAKQFPSRIAVATTKEGSRKMAEINFDPSDSAIDHILKDGITFENDAVRLLPCRALDPAVPLVRLRLSNLPFLKEDILKEQLKMSLEPYGSALDLGILRESHTGTYMDFLLFLTIFLGINQKMKAFMLCGVTCPPIVATVMLKDMLSLIVQRNVHPVFVGTVALVAILLLNAQKARISHLKKARKISTAPQDRVDQVKVQSSQASSGITMPTTSSQPLTSNTMKRKRSIRNESRDDPRIHSSTLLTTEEDSILVSTQEVLKAIFTTTAESQDDTPMEINARNTDNPYVATDIVIVDQATKNIPQSQHQAAMDSHHNSAPPGYNFRHDSLDNLGLPIQACIPRGQQHGTTVFNIDGALTQSKQ
ncbi:hypothetical protein RO3G_14874 [Rhizopus delemar RA 99-880]|uniref:Uncharacterized protein n=1 Tax=Rhizopus delemar (strain RA 99-880 / ATCC MYA-4621 / FGSC 9543 / NRRL 43880) TaxID=246409 RepID=I1CNY3_RHIO9|nr:hypothetical protein RO3G_14857 [Rhizopus delemar RA 99-880]EIE90163.1 hypothetical protein RO3G_14874 [Rhizopus delemar RA 99-880]|eukprot:EIE90146.1 hypothetical protein RO3G_14857 [Rhizopus delemar RA 99-880]